MIDYYFNQAELCWGASANLSETDVRRILQGIKDVGASGIRMAVQLGTVAELDRAVTLSVEYGLKPLLCLINNQAFGYAATVESFGTFARNIATRYGPSGTGALKNTVMAIECFNEPNSSLNPPGVDPANFVKYLQSGYNAIKSVHSSCTVIAGGTIPAPDTWIPWIGVAYNPVNWYRQVLAAGGGAYFDAWGFHLYADTPPSPSMVQWKYMTDIRDLMVANGFADKKAWITEVGVGFPAPGVADLTMARDWLKIMVEGIESYSWTGPFAIYNWKNYAAGDGVGGTYGMVDINFVPRSPMFEYAQSIVGTPSNPLDIIPPSAPTGLMSSDVMSTSAKFTWNPNPAIDVATNYRLKTLAGVQLIDTRNTSCTPTGLPSGTPQSFYVTAVDGAGNESLPSNVVALTTNAPTGLQADFTVAFTGSDIPSTLTQLGLGFTVAAGVATPIAPTVNGKYVTVAPYTLDLQSPDHSSRISLAAKAGGADRTAMALVRMSPDGADFVAAASPGGGNADSLLILTSIAGKITVRKARNTTPAGAGNDLMLTVTGNVYTAQIMTAGASVMAQLVWTDLAGVFGGSTNRRPGLGWRHTRSKSINYPAPGITRWAAADLGPIQRSGGFDPWMLAVTDEDDLGLVVSTGLWEPLTI